MANGAYFDGKSAKKHAVHVSLVGMELTIQTERGERLARGRSLKFPPHTKTNARHRCGEARRRNAVLIIRTTAWFRG